MTSFLQNIKSVPNYCILVLVSSTAILIGIEWDISWHESIGRDSFWSAPHMVIYFGGILCGLTCAWMVFQQTFFHPDKYKHYVKFWGFKGPLACWICIWGMIAMLTSAPFDDWWHNTYGLDVQIVSPPHIVLALGIFAIFLGSLQLVLAERNLAQESQKKIYDYLYLYAASLILLQFCIILTEYSFANKQHSLEFYKLSTIFYGFVIIAFSEAARTKYAATIIAGLYMIHRLLILWILPLFEAEPLLGPIYREITHYVAPPFPPLLIIPAIIIDIVRSRFTLSNKILKAIIFAIIFTLIFLLTQWYFSEFLLSEYARNWVFGSDRNKPFWVPVGDFNFEYWDYDWTPYGHKIPMSPVTVKNMALTLVYSIFSIYLALLFSGWLKRVKK